jgi:hypothetical protein
MLGVFARAVAGGETIDCGAGGALMAGGAQGVAELQDARWFSREEARTMLERSVKKSWAAGELLVPPPLAIAHALADGGVHAVLERAHDAGVRNAAYIVLRLPLDIKDLFEEWLQSSHPGRAKHVMSILRSMRQGKAYDAEWGKRMTGTGTYAELIAKRFKLACDRLGLNREWASQRTDLFAPPPKAGDQLTLL